MKFVMRFWLIAALLALLAVGAVSRHAPAVAANPETLPDLQTVIPTDATKGFSIVTSAEGQREFRYTHLIYNAGPGPLEIQPAYNPASGGYRGEQLTYQLSGSTWSASRRIRVPDTFVFHAAHGHFHFPLASFGLYAVAADGGLGRPVALSPKIGFCIDDSYVYNKTLPNAGHTIARGQGGTCADPLSVRGISIGGADEYDYRDPGQAIPIDGVPDGTYWFKAVSDPNNDFLEADEHNNEADVKVTIAGSSVTAGETRYPDTASAEVSLAQPLEGSVARGTTWMVAEAGSEAASVSFLVDGAVVGTVTSAPWSWPWDTTKLADGSHWLAARVTDRRGNTDTTDVRAVTVANAGSGAALSLVGSATAYGVRQATTALSNLQAGDHLVALVSSDGPDPGQQSATVSSSTGGLTWRRIALGNGQPGGSEAWTAAVPDGTTGANVTARLTLTDADFDLGVSVLAFRGAKGVGAVATASNPGGRANPSATKPSVSLTPTSHGSRVYAVGNDWDRGIARVLPPGQEAVFERSTDRGDTLWGQRLSSLTGRDRAAVTLSSGPATGHWNMAAVEILSASPDDVTAPTVRLDEPLEGDTLSGLARLSATAADTVGVTRVDFLVDGTVVGQSATPPFAVVWDSKAISPGAHTLVAKAYDGAGNVGSSSPVPVQVSTFRKPAEVSVASTAYVEGTSTVRTPGQTTSPTARLLLALVAQDGPENGRQGVTVTSSSSAVVWRRVNALNTQTGAAEIWSAWAPATALTDVRTTATPSIPGYDTQLTVLALSGASGTGVSGVSGRLAGQPSIYLPGVEAASWVVAVGNDPDRAEARTVVPGQRVLQEWVHTTPTFEHDTGGTYWVQALAAPTSISGLVTLTATSPSTNQWNLAAVEIKAAALTGRASSARSTRPGIDPNRPFTPTRPGRGPLHHR